MKKVNKITKLIHLTKLCESKQNENQKLINILKQNDIKLEKKMRKKSLTR